MTLLPDIDVRSLRLRMGLTRLGFSQTFGLNETAVREWEVGRRRPDQAARVLIAVIAHNHRAVIAALEAAGRGGEISA